MLFSAIRNAAPLLPEHHPDRRKHLVSRLQRATGGGAAIVSPRLPPRVRPTPCKVSSARFIHVSGQSVDVMPSQR